MNYAGKFDAAISLDGEGSHSLADVHADSFAAKPFIAKAHGHVPEGAFVVPDPNLIFHGDFKRAGADLVLSHDGREFVVHDYFRGDKRAAISSPDGAHLTGDVVNALTGYVQYAQAAPGVTAAQVIGHVTKLSGSATAVRNGVSVVLNNGDNVEQGDVVSTGGDSTLGITFIDGTVFGLSSNARMVLNEMVYDPNGSSNSSLLSLVAGTITFVAGETAKHGDMKIDTPVATMGIRGTAVLTQINFVVPAGGGDPQPQASFQVLVEPNGTTGSYILFDKVTLLPIATVNQAGQMIQISGGNVTISNALMSPDVQKLITDVFTLKFTDNNSNTKLTSNFTDSITQTSQDLVFKSGAGPVVIATFTNLNPQGSEGPGNSTPSATRIPGQPLVQSLDLNGNVKTAFGVTERADKTGDTADSDIISGQIPFIDQNLGDRPTVSVSRADAPNYVYKNAGQQDVTGSLSALQKQDIAATQIQISVVADPANTNIGSAVWTYTIPDNVFDFLAAGETLTLTYIVRIDTNFAVSPESKFIPITITITGTNDKPVITTGVPTITFEGGTSRPGGPLTSHVPTSGTLTFKDVDLTDTHTVSVKLTGATLPDGTVPPGPLAAFQNAMSVAIAAGADSKGSGIGTINWSLADLPVYLADFIPKGEVLTLTYTVTVTDAQGATAQQTITVTITGTDAPAVVWIATDHAGAPSGGFWKDAANWETGTVPTIDDDVIVITDQLHGLTPSYPVTIDAAAYAKSITMNDFGGPPPKVINQSSLTVAGALNMSADSIFTNAATGAMSIGGKAEILDTAVLTNAGYLTLKGGGDFASGTTITNSGTIELFGGTLKTLADIANAGGILKTDAGSTLIVDTATVDGGTVTILGMLELDGISLIENGTLNNSGAVNVKGAAEFAHETVSNTSAGTIKVLANGWLTIDQGSTVTNTGNVTVDANGKLTVNGATINGAGTVTGNGEIDLAGNVVLDGGILNNNAAFKVGGTGNALDGEIVTNASTGTIEVLANGALTIDLGSAIANTGNVTVDANGKLTVNGATISGAGVVTGNGEIDLTGGAVLSGGILKNSAVLNVSGIGNALDGETITNAGTIEVLANGALTIGQGATVANPIGNVVVDANAVLTLDGATISGGGVNGSGTIDVTGASTIDGGATLSTSAVIVDAKLTLDGITVSGSTITDNASIEVDNTVKLGDNAKIQGASAAAKGAITNTGTLEIAGAATLLNDVLTNTGHTVQIDDGQTLTLSGTEITGGTIENYSGALGGTIDVTGNSTIDGNATLNKGNVKVESGVTLTLGDAAVSGTKITNDGTVKLDASRTLTLSGASLAGGMLAVSGTLDSSGFTTITDANISNSYLIEAIGGVLALVGTATTITNNVGGTIQANGAELDINGEAVTNTGTLAAINNGTLKLIATTVPNTGTVSVESGSMLDLAGATINGGTVTISGTLESTGTSAINGADFTNNGTIDVTSGTLSIDPTSITNNLLIEVNGAGAVLDISGDPVNNSGTLEAINGGTLKLTGLTVTNLDGIVLVGGASKLYLSSVTINDGNLNNAGNLYSVSGFNKITAAVDNAGGSIEVQAGTLDLAGGLTGAGSLIIDGGATLELAGANAQTVTFAGGTDTLQLDKVAGQSFTGTIAGQSTTGGTFTIMGAGNITTSSGDALDFTALGGAPANIVLTPTGALTGAVNGIVVTQNGTGGISLTAAKDITGLNGNGITLRDSATGVGSITVNNLTGKATGTGVNSEGILVENLNAANNGDISITQLGGAVGGAYGIDATTQGGGDISINAGGNMTGSSIYGIRARSYGSGSESVTTGAGSVVTSGSSGIIAVNRATSLDSLAGSTITVENYGTIHSGSSLNQSGSAPAGIQAGYTGATTGSDANTLVNGTVVVNNHANITAAGGHGIDAYNYGIGDVTVNNGADTSVVGAQMGIRARALSGGTGNVSVSLGANASVTGTAGYGVDAYSIDQGNISVSLSGNDTIISGSSGILAVNEAISIASDVHSTIQVTAHGTIHSGSTSNLSGSAPGGIVAGYNPSGDGIFSNNVHGDVIVTSDATITADAGYGIEAFTWGVGDVTVTTGATSSIAAAGTAIGAFDHGGGDVSVTNNGSATGAVGISAIATGAGDVTIINHGGVTSTSLAGISVTQNEAGASGSTFITNTGSIVAPNAHAAIYIKENTAGGSVQIDNSATGTIGPAVASNVTSTTYAIVETGGAIVINNAGHINGNISVATATFNNQAGGTWTVAGTSVFGNASSIVNHGAIDLHGGSISGAGLSIENCNDIDSWGTASISGTIANAGTIEIHDGALMLFGSLSGSGSVTVDAGALLTLDGAVSQTIALAGDGAKLQIDTSTFSGSIAELSATDTIDLSTIKYGLGTSAVYVSNADATTGGVLTVTDADGNHISLTLSGADYSDATFAGSSDGHGGTLITLNAADDAPVFTAAEISQSASFSELAGATDSSALDPASGGTGTIHFKDVDLTDRPIASITAQTVSWTGADHTTNLSGFLTTDEVNALDHALTLQQTGKNNGTVGWSYSIADNALDFLGEGQTAKVVSTITLDDCHNETDPAQVTVTITGKNDAPTLNNATLGAINEDAAAPAGSSVGALFSAGFHDADAGASFKAVAITASHATAAQGVWQYEVTGGNQWIDISGVSDTGALVLAPDTLIRFMPAANYSGTPGSLDVHALDDTYGADVTTPVLIDITTPGIGSSVSAQAATLSTDVKPVADAPAFSIDYTPIADTGEFLVNTTTANDQTYSAVGALSDGGYVIGWVSQGQDGDGTGIYAQHYASSGAKVGGEFRVNTATAGDQSSPYVVGLEGGGFVASWTSGSNNGATIHLQRYDASGSLAGGEVSLSGYGENATLAALSNGGFVITYVSSDSNASGTYGVVYDASGCATSGPFLINTTTASTQQGDSVAGTTDGGFVASWHSYGQDGDGWGVYFQRFDAQGNKLGGEVQVNTNAVGHQYGGELAVLKDGSIVVSYSDANALVLRHFSSTGTPIGSEVSISDATTDTVQALPDGGFLVTYQGHDVSGSLGLLGQRFDASLQSISSSFVINETTAGDQVFLADRSNPTAVTTAGKIVSTWFSPGIDGHDVEARVFTLPGLGSEDSPIKLPAITAAVLDTDGSETLLIKLSGYPAGATFSMGQPGTGADAGHWLIGATDIASLGTPGLTMTAPAGYHGEFSLDVGMTVIDLANGLSGPLTDTYTVTKDVAVKVDGGPVIDTTDFHVEHVNENSTDIITDLVVIDNDAGAATDNFTVEMSTAPVPATNSSVDLSPTSGTLTALNAGLANGITYHPGASPPNTDQITLKVTDTTTGRYDTVHFTFNEAGDTSLGVTLQGTSGKDIIFATETGDTLTGGDGKDQFVFAPGSTGDNAQHTITDFVSGLDKIDLRLFSDVSSVSNLAIAPSSGDTLVTFSHQISASVTEHEAILLKNVVANLKASDFIFHA
ncbi:MULTISPECIES: VCBS domain-containing protein [unclassified Bradyrhizobium]|uniref:VCBS domain-containing protein n=1 Tax=unclassified Bradyrhizobium TaxID=2631580 RepID=UPI001FF8BF33|nr:MULTISPECIES: VCBS domain-containing protein [unclassified Bradyrhizobium]MCK1712828.1 VCBS domain-containing protein [Bradyrhizobium sp. 143]MCK1725123.1 VCBS domain-containing protein [Bradyrhizobium sp. 142]